MTNRDIKIIFLDIDGTLLSFKTHHVPQSTLDAVRRARQRGLKVWIATGRPMPFVGPLDGLEVDGVMCVNGAHCELCNSTATTKDSVVFSQPVDPADVERMVDEQKRTGMAVCYAGRDKAIIAAPKGLPHEVDEVFTLLDIRKPELCEPDEALSFEVMQIIAFFTREESPRIMGEVLCGCNETRWHPAFADCLVKGMDKAAGIDKVLAYYGFSLHQAMAFGDGGNDITMLQHVGTGVAMGNASDEVKQAADIVTTSVDDNGIANVLDKL